MIGEVRITTVILKLVMMMHHTHTRRCRAGQGVCVCGPGEELLGKVGCRSNAALDLSL